MTHYVFGFVSGQWHSVLFSRSCICLLFHIFSVYKQLTCSFYTFTVPNVAPPTPPATLGPDYRCPAGWSAYGDYCYQVQPGDGTWNEALSDCRRLGTDLISIHDMNENDYIVSLMQQSMFVSVRQKLH